MNANTSASGTSDASPKIGGRALVRFALVVLLQCAILFVSAGTLRWPMGWVFIGIYLVLSAGSRVLLLRMNPDLITERARFTEGEGVKDWDKALVPVIAILGPILTMVVAGLNFRFGWPPILPVWVQIAGAILVVLGTALGTWAMLANRFFSAVVRIQTDRGHTVVSTGPYRFVRHPGYAGGVVANLAVPLMLGSAWALIPAGVVAGLTIVRTALEDRTLRQELPGYADYAQRTRYRLLPGVW